MTLEIIYVTRHGFRSNWLVNHNTGQYSSTFKTPTGIPADPALTAHGVEQSRELGAHLLAIQPPIDKVFSSPYYRCLQTVEPYVKQTLQKKQAVAGSAAGPDTDIAAQLRSTGGPGSGRIRCESGLGEWYGSAPFEHPSSAAPETLHSLFPGLLDSAYQPIAVPSRKGESVDELHDRVALTLEAIVAQCDADGTRAVLLCSHAAVIVAMGRVLTGRMPVEIDEQDFQAFTCGLSVYRRRGTGDNPTAAGDRAGADVGAQSSVPSLSGSVRDGPEKERTSSTMSSEPGTGAHHDLRLPRWRGGVGVAGGWDCELDSDCSFLSGGEERGWRFAGDESFQTPGSNSADAGDLGVVVEGGQRPRSRQPGASTTHL